MNEMHRVIGDLAERQNDTDELFLLREENEILHSVIGSLSEGVIVADKSGRFVFFNATARDILGIGYRNIKMEDWTVVYGCFRPDTVTPFPSQELPLARAIRGEEVLNEVIYIRNESRPEGIFINVSAGPLKDRHGNIWGGTVILGDITRSKRNENELHKLSSAVEQTADSVVITEKKGVIEYVNPAFENTTGYTRHEVIGRNMSILKSGQHDRAFYDHLWKTISEGRPYNGLIVNRKKEGDLYWSEQTITPMKDEEGRIQHYVTVLRDITQARKQQEQNLQISMAREVQSRLYQKEMTIRGLEVSGSSLPAAETNGDYYDVIRMDENSYGIVIGDVSGHGISSAMIMAQTRAYLHAFTRHELDPAILLNLVNRELAGDLDESRFVTLVFVRIDLERREMVYASAGHMPGFLLTKSGEMQVLDSTGIPLGFIADYQYEKSKPIHLDPGDIFVLLTDGIIEAHDTDENEFGFERTLETIRQNSNASLREIQKKVHDAVLAFSSGGDQEDDITSVICRFKPGNAYPVTMGHTQKE